MSTTVQDQVTAFVSLTATGDKPLLALYAAKAVQSTKRGTRGRGRSENSERMSADAFAKAVHKSDKTITRYLETWDAFAERGDLPTRPVPLDWSGELPDKTKWRDTDREVHPPAPKPVKETAPSEDTETADEELEVEGTPKKTRASEKIIGQLRDLANIRANLEGRSTPLELSVARVYEVFTDIYEGEGDLNVNLRHLAQAVTELASFANRPQS